MKTLYILIMLTVNPNLEPVPVEMEMKYFSEWKCKTAIEEILKRQWFANNKKVDVIKMECTDENTVSN